MERAWVSLARNACRLWCNRVLVKFCSTKNSSKITEMARGQQKIQSQAKAQEKKDKLKKAQGSDQKKSAQKALKYSCPVCKSQMPDPKTFKQHFESKHPKNELPPELKDI